MIESMVLPNICKACNKYLIPNVLCPYGCSAFIHRHGSISFDLLLQRYLQKHIIKKLYSNRNGFKYLISTRDDYIRNDDDYDQWLLNNNPSWRIRPSITFLDGVPHVMTCDEHDKGTTSLFVHTPRSPGHHSLPSKFSDQLSHCAIRTRSIKPMQKKYYSTSYQMHEQRGSFNGIDTCNISTYRKFDFRSSLLSKYESRAIINRPDINALLNQLIEEKTLSKFTANGKRAYASKLFFEFDFTKYYIGATYVPFEAAMSMQRELSNNAIVSIIIDQRYEP